MKRNARRILFLLLSLALIPFCCFYCIPEIPYYAKEAYVPPSTPDPLISQITNEFSRYENREIPYVDLSTITSFDWDRLYVIGAFPSFQRLNSLFGLSWMSCSTNTYWHDGWDFLVFTLDGKIVRCFDYPVYPYAFSMVATGYPDGIPAKEAIFISHGADDFVELIGIQ